MFSTTSWVSRNTNTNSHETARGQILPMMATGDRCTLKIANVKQLTR
jgi:hypothetical protein